MVNNNPRLLVSGACQTHVNHNSRTIIVNGPVYDLVKVQSLLKGHGLIVINDNAELDQIIQFVPALDDDELLKFILELKMTDFENSERCATSVGRTVDSDSYAMNWNRFRKERWGHGQKIYVKFGFFDNNPKCVVVSIHPAKY